MFRKPLSRSLVELLKIPRIVIAYSREVTPMQVISLSPGEPSALVLARLNRIRFHVVDVGTEPYAEP